MKMKNRTLHFIPFVAPLLIAGTVNAAPIQIDFNVGGFGPAANSVQSSTKPNVTAEGLALTFSALDENLVAKNKLYWDADDGQGFGLKDGFGVVSENDPFSYEYDEIEGNERLQLQFSEAVTLLSFNITDLYYENQDPANLTSAQRACDSIGKDGCYRESGYYMLTFGDGTTSGWNQFLADYDKLNSPSSNGEHLFGINLSNVTGLILKAPGLLDVQGFGYTQRHEFSLAGVKIEQTAVPEPASVMLLSSGLLGALGLRRKRA